MSNVLRVRFGSSRSVNADPLWQYDYGQILKMEGLDLPIGYEVHFAKYGSATSYTEIGTADGVDIPDELLQTAGDLHAWLYLHTGEDDGETEYQVNIPVNPRARPTNDTPSSVQQDAITEAIAALQTGVNAAEAAQAAAEAAQDAIEDLGVMASTLDADASATVTKSVDVSTGAVTLSFGIPKGAKGDTGAAGRDGTDGTNGTDGQDGSPGADGRDGTDGQDGTSAYVWIRYAADQPTADSDMKTTPDAWMGIYSGDSSTAPEHYTNYTWYNIKGQTGPVSDVQVNGTTVVSGGVASIPLADSNTFGVIRPNNNSFDFYNGGMIIRAASESEVKNGTNSTKALVSGRSDATAFYGLAKAAGADMKDIASTTVGVYPEAQKSAISEMLGGSVAVSGSTPTINAKAGISYVCGECSTLDIVVPESGCFDVAFESGSTPTALSIPMPTGYELIWENGFDDTSLEANTVYEINLRLLGTRWLGVAGQWAT